jgi:hypothetical protein
MPENVPGIKSDDHSIGADELLPFTGNLTILSLHNFSPLQAHPALGWSPICLSHGDKNRPWG